MPLMTVTCHTDGCGNAGIAIALEIDPDLPPNVYVCGVCGERIADQRAGVEDAGD